MHIRRSLSGEGPTPSCSLHHASSCTQAFAGVVGFGAANLADIATRYQQHVELLLIYLIQTV